MKLARIVFALALVGLMVGAAALVYAAPADTGAAAKPNAPSAKQLLDEAKKLYAARNYVGALGRLEQIKSDQLGFFENIDYKSVLDKAKTAVTAKDADQKAFDAGRQAYESKNYAVAVQKLSQAASSDYLDSDKASAAKGLLAKAKDEQAAAEKAAMAKAGAEVAAKAKTEADEKASVAAVNAKADTEVAAKAKAKARADAETKAKAEADAKAASDKAFAEAKKAYEARNFDEAQKQLKAVNVDYLNFLEKGFVYNPLQSKIQKAIAGKAADEKALAAGQADLAAKKYAGAIAKLSDAASSDYLAKDQIDTAKAGIAQARGEVAKAEKAAADAKLAQAKEEADKKAKADAEVKAAKAKAEEARLAKAKEEADKQAKADAEAKAAKAKAEEARLAKAKEEADKQAKADAEARIARAKADAEAKALAQAKVAEKPAPVAVAEKPVKVMAAATMETSAKPAESPARAVAKVTVASAEPAAPVAAGTLMQQAKRAEAEEETKLGAAALAQNEYEKAKIHYKKALDLWPESDKAKVGLKEALQLTGEQTEPLANTLKNVREMERGRIIAEVQDLEGQAERILSKAERPEDYNEALRPLAQADRTIDVSGVLMPEEQERLREEVYVLRKEITARQATARGSRDRKAAQEAATSETQRRAAAEADRQNKVRQLWDRASELRKSMQFDEAIQILDRLIVIDPNDERALRWRDDLQYLEAQAVQVGNRDLRKTGTVAALTDVEDAAIQPGERVNGEIRYLRYPQAKDWEEMTKRRRELTKAISAELKAVAETRRRLNEDIDLDFEKTSLDNVLKYISEVQRGLNIVIDPDIAAAGVDLSTRVVDLKVKRVSVESVLGLILGGDLGYRVESGYILITTKDKLQQNLPVVTYPVQDLVATIPDFADLAPRFDVANVLASATAASGGGGGGGTGLFGANKAAAPAEPTAGSTELIAIIQRTVSATSDPAVAGWSDEAGPAAIEYMNGLLIITQTRRGHEKVSDLLEQLRRERAIMISVEARFCQVSDSFLQDITLDVDAAFLNGGQPWSPGANPTVNSGTLPLPTPFNTLPGTNSPAGAASPFYGQPAIISSTGSNGQGTSTLLPLTSTAFSKFGMNEGGMVISGVFLDDIQLGFLLRAIQADIRSSVLQAPRITLYNGQRSYISVSKIVAYIADATPVVSTGATSWDPQIGAVPVGVTLDVKATVSADRRYVQMDLRPQQADLDIEGGGGGFKDVDITGSAGGGAVLLPGGVVAEPSKITIQLPRVRIQDFMTTVSVPDSGTLLLGGTRTFSEADAETGVPILSKVPILKRLFNNRASVRTASNLLILIRPKIIIQAEEERRMGYDNF